MRILLVTYLFPPSVGGIETMSELLAYEFARAGHEVRVLTPTPAKEPDTYPFEVHRAPSRSTVWADFLWCDVFFHNNISLAFAWPLLFASRPWIVSHQTWLTRNTGRLAWQDHLKRVILRCLRSISISSAIARSIPTPSVVIPNCYGEDTFDADGTVAKDREIAFVGRLVGDKGVDLLLDAVAELARRSLRPQVTIFGDGPERERLVEQARRTGIAGQVTFAGVKRGRVLAAQLGRHRIMVVPSRWAEPFGIVALEGIACGCIVVGSSAGGLADAIGPCGVTFPNGDAHKLAVALEKLLLDPDADKAFSGSRTGHLALHKRSAVASRYLEVFASSLPNGPQP